METSVEILASTAVCAFFVWCVWVVADPKRLERVRRSLGGE